MDKETKKHSLSKSELVDQIPLACADEVAAVEFFERQRWGSEPACVHCGSVSVYKMKDAKTGERNKRFLWRCHDCKMQYTVRVGTVYEESHIPLRHWAYAFWRACTSKKGVSALEIKRQCQISYKSALFLMNRIRFAMAPDFETAPKLVGIVEADETYVDGKPRLFAPKKGKAGRGTAKTPVFAVVQRQGGIRRKVMANVTAHNLRTVLHQVVDPFAVVYTDEYALYRNATKGLGGHQTVKHSAKEYVRGNVHTNTVESSFSLLKRGMMGIYHNVSKEHLHRYVSQFDFMWNHRKLNDGERTVKGIRSAEYKRLMYKAS